MTNSLTFPHKRHPIPVISLAMRQTNERRRYNVTTSLIGWAHTWADPCHTYSSMVNAVCAVLSTLYIVQCYTETWLDWVIGVMYCLYTCIIEYMAYKQGSFCMHPANERWRYNVWSSLIGLAHAQNDPCIRHPVSIPGIYIWYNINGWVQDCSNSSALAMDFLQSCTKPLICNDRNVNIFRINVNMVILC